MNEPVLGWERLQGRSGHEAGRQLLRAMYEKQVGAPLPRIAIGDRGKPYFPDSPWHFSISHTPDHVFCALAPEPVGLDAEEADRTVRPALAQRVLSPGELRQWEASADRSRAFLTFWVLKEALVKCSGEGLRGYPSHTAFSLNDPRVREIDGCLVAVITGKDA